MWQPYSQSQLHPCLQTGISFVSAQSPFTLLRQNLTPLWRPRSKMLSHRSPPAASDTPEGQRADWSCVIGHALPFTWTCMSHALRRLEPGSFLSKQTISSVPRRTGPLATEMKKWDSVVLNQSYFLFSSSKWISPRKSWNQWHMGVTDICGFSET